MTSLNQNGYSPAKCGADNGLRFGVYLSLIYAAMIGSAFMPVANLIMLVLLVGVPFFVFRLLSADYRRAAGGHNLAAVWLNGMMTFICGGLLASLVLFVYLRWVNPGFLSMQWDMIVNGFASSPDPSLREFSEQCRAAAENGFQVSPIIFSMSLLWMVAFAGTLTSLVLAVIIALRGRKRFGRQSL